MTLTLRTYQDADLPAIAALLHEALPYDRPGEAYVRYLLLDDPGFDPQLIWVAEDKGQVAGFVSGALPNEQLQCPGGIKLFAVAPAFRGRGIASQLFDLAEAGMRARGVQECVAINCGNNRLSLGLDVRYTAALCLLLKRGYVSTGPTQDMWVPLVAGGGERAGSEGAGPGNGSGSDQHGVPDLTTSAAEAHLTARGIIVRRARANERRWVSVGVTRTMVAPTPNRRWAYLAEQAFRHLLPTIEVAEAAHDGAFLGFAAYDAARWGALGPMGVAPETRGAGLGSVLLKRCLRDMQAAGYERGEIFSVGPIPFYAKTIGATISRVFYRYTKQL